AAVAGLLVLVAFGSLAVALYVRGLNADLGRARDAAEMSADSERTAREAADRLAAQEKTSRENAEEAQKQAAAAAEQSRRRLSRLTVASGLRLMDEGDLARSLVWFAEAVKLDQGRPEDEETHRLRFAGVLRQCPRLVQAWTFDSAVQ